MKVKVKELKLAVKSCSKSCVIIAGWDLPSNLGGMFFMRDRVFKQLAAMDNNDEVEIFTESVTTEDGKILPMMGFYNRCI